MNLHLGEEKNKKKFLIISIVFFICLICAEYIYTSVHPYISQKKEYEKILIAEDINNYQGYSFENDIFKPESDDSKLIIGDCGDIVSKITVNLKEPMESDTDVSLYYSKNSNGRGEYYCKKLLRSEDKKIEFNFGAQKYRYISLKIDGEFSLDSIEMNLNKGVNNSKNEKIIFVCIDIVLFCILAVINRTTLITMLKRDDKKNDEAIKTDINPHKIRIEKIFLIWALIGGLMVSVLVPSAQVPDEYAHLLMMQEELGLKGYAENANDVYLSNINSGKIMTRNGEKQDVEQYIEKSKEKFSNNLHITIRPSIKIVRHFAANIGFLLCLLINLPIFWCLQISEIFALIFYILLGYYVIKLMPVKKELLAVIMLLPMSLQQAGSLNYDATLIPVCCLYIAYVVHLLYSEEKIGWKKLGFILLLLSVIAIIKPPYALLFIVLFIIPVKQYNLKIKEINLVQNAYRFRWLILALFCIAVLAGVYLLQNNVYVLEVVASVVKLPKYLLIMLRTLRSLFTFYVVSAIGSFGWLDCRVDIWYIAFTVILCIILTQVDEKKESRFNIKRLLICIVCFIMIFNLIYISMEVWTAIINNWTVENNLSAWLECIDKINIIEGVQGRYLIPIIPIIGMLIPAIKKIRKESACFMINVYAVISILHVVLILIKRYWVSTIW